MENTHKKVVGNVVGLGIRSIKDARFTNSGNVVVYATAEPNKSTRVSVTNALRGKTRQVTWKSTRGNHKTFAVTTMKA